MFEEATHLIDRVTTNDEHRRTEKVRNDQMRDVAKRVNIYCQGRKVKCSSTTVIQQAAPPVPTAR